MKNIYPISQHSFCRDDPRRLVDDQGRSITYLRLAVTDRCNLHCRYCMPAGGIPNVAHKEMLSFEEMTRLIGIFTSLGVSKVRITGGEPFVRRGLLDFISGVKKVPGVENIHLTTNGVAVAEHIPALQQLGIAGINLSLDTLRPERFQAITGRNSFHQVMKTFEQIINHEIPLKINTVLFENINADEIVSMAILARDNALTVRFIEQMPFNDTSRIAATAWSGSRTLNTLQKAFPDLQQKTSGSGTATLYKIPGFKGLVGIISGYSRQFCKLCNKVRVTPQGMLKTCLYDSDALDIKKLLRNGVDDQQIIVELQRCVKARAVNGFAAEAVAADPVKRSMAAIGG